MHSVPYYGVKGCPFFFGPGLPVDMTGKSQRDGKGVTGRETMLSFQNRIGVADNRSAKGGISWARCCTALMSINWSAR